MASSAWSPTMWRRPSDTMWRTSPPPESPNARRSVPSSERDRSGRCLPTRSTTAYHARVARNHNNRKPFASGSGWTIFARRWDPHSTGGQPPLRRGAAFSRKAMLASATMSSAPQALPGPERCMVMRVELTISLSPPTSNIQRSAAHPGQIADQTITVDNHYANSK